jgi:hypothetical protein
VSFKKRTMKAVNKGTIRGRDVGSSGMGPISTEV